MAEPWRRPEEWARDAQREYIGPAGSDPADYYHAAMDQVRERCVELVRHAASLEDAELCLRALNLDTGEDRT